MSTSTAKVRISLACAACKKRKAKCSGGPPPCQSCKASGTQCVIDESLDGRRKASAKRTFDELTFHKSFIEGLLTYIRICDQSSLEHLVSLIKADVPLTEVGAMIDERLQLSCQGTPTEESLRLLHLTTPSSPSVRRKLESEHTLESPITPSTTEHFPKFPLEWQARQLDHQQSLIHFLQNTSHEEVEELSKYLQESSSSNLYDILLQYSKDVGRHGSRRMSVTSPPSSRRRSTSRAALTGVKFSSARNLSVPNLLQYQQYLQEFFSDYTPKELSINANIDDIDRKSWHPSLRLRFSTPSGGSDESMEGENTSTKASLSRGINCSEEGDNTGAMGPEEKRRHLAQESIRKQNPDRMRLRLDNDPQTGQDFQLSHILGGGSVHTPKQTERNSSEDLAADAVTRRMTSLNVPLYSLLPLTGIDDSPLARSYTSYRDEARAMLANGLSTNELFGSHHIRVDLLFRSRRPTDAHSVCNWATELCAAFSRDFTMSWTLASIAAISRLMRWLLIPTEQSYKEMPSTVRPTQLQRFIPHNPVTDLVPIPAIRDALCVRFRDWLTPFIDNSHFNWPYSLEEAVVHDIQADTYRLSEHFERYVHDSNNWRINRRVIEAFPEIAGRSDIHFSD